MGAGVKEAPPVAEIVREEDGKFKKGESGNPLGRPKGSKNKITLIKQSMELKLREEAAPDISAVLAKAVELALEGDRQMIKLLLDAHMSKGTLSDDVRASEKVAIQINAAMAPEIKSINTTEESSNGGQEADE